MVLMGEVGIVDFFESCKAGFACLVFLTFFRVYTAAIFNR